MTKNDEGVYYNIQDYASLLRRLIAIAIDASILLILSLIIAWIWSLFVDMSELNDIVEYGWLAIGFFYPYYFGVCILIAYFYLAILKPTHLGTIGYRCLNLSIVDMQGNRPSVFKMTWRFLLLIFGPFHMFIDLFWLGGDEARQTIRDKMAGTYVIKRNSRPIGTGRFVFSQYYFLGMSFIFKNVKKE